MQRALALAIVLSCGGVDSIPLGGPRDAAVGFSFPDMGSAPDCPVGRVRCRDECVDPTSDPKNCGRCGMACTVCVASKCAPTANEGRLSAGYSHTCAITF